MVVIDKVNDNYIVIDTNRNGNRKAYKNYNDEIFLDCKHCGRTNMENFGTDKRGFMKKRSECTPCRRRTKNEREKIGKETFLIVKTKKIRVFYYKVSQAKRFAYIDDEKNIYFICSVCNLAKHTDDFYNETGGLLDKKSKCKACTDIINDKWLEYNEERAKETNIVYRARNKVRISNQRKEYREKNKERIYFQKRNYREKYKRKLYFKKRTYREENKEKEKKRIATWHNLNPHKQQLYSQKRSAREKELPDTLTDGQLIEILNKYDNRCCLTGEKAHLDHIIPLYMNFMHRVHNTYE